MPEIRNLDTVMNIFSWFLKAVPKPGTKNVTTQMGVHFEEVLEMVECLVPIDSTTDDILLRARAALRDLATHLKTHEGCVDILEPMEEDYLDALCDQIVTAIGCGRMRFHDIDGALAEVSRSNDSKFDSNGNPIFDANLKITKGPNYFKANLKPYLFALKTNN